MVFLNKLTYVRGWNSSVGKRVVSSPTAMPMTTDPGYVVYQARQGVHNGSEPLIGRDVISQLLW